MLEVRKNTKPGFTLIELLVTMAIMGILITIVLGIATYAMRKSRESKSIADMQLISNALEEYRVTNGSYPDSLGAVTGVELVDPYGSNYVYSKVSRYAFSLRSEGPDLTPDTGDEIINGK